MLPQAEQVVGSPKSFQRLPVPLHGAQVPEMRPSPEQKGQASCRGGRLDSSPQVVRVPSVAKARSGRISKFIVWRL